MRHVRICDDLTEAEHLWKTLWPEEQIFDLWPVRAAFQNAYMRPPCFIVTETNGRADGLLALSRLTDTETENGAAHLAHFPGETWEGKTWLEQNRIIARDADTFRMLTDHVPGPAHIRYLTADALDMDCEQPQTDETGYLFYPRACGCSYEAYLEQFPGKTRKKLRAELRGLNSMEAVWRHDHASDLEWLLDMNLQSFGEKSYFNDPRFFRAFQDMAAWLRDKGLLRITALTLDGKLAAVDVGAAWKGNYTVLAGGTDPEFPGVAKIINFHHIEWACKQRFNRVDFLCGDFGWKERFRLTPRPLYQLQLFSETRTAEMSAPGHRPLARPAAVRMETYAA